MRRLRCMTYNVNGFRGGDGRYDPARCGRVMRDAGAELIALQETDSGDRPNPLPEIARDLGLELYLPPGHTANAFLSRHPLKGLQAHDLGADGWCLRADLDQDGRRLHLLNLQLSLTPLKRHIQFGNLLGPSLLGNPSLVCPMLVLGDFADPLWWLSSLSLERTLTQAPRPLWSATYPAALPLIGRDRAYLRGPVRVAESQVLRSPLTRRASSHPPVPFRVQVQDPGCYLRVPEFKRGRVGTVAPG